MRKDDPKSLDPLELEEFYKEINSREGFFHESIEKEPLLELERNLVEDSRRSNSNKTRDIFLETASGEPMQDLESSCEEYDDNSITKGYLLVFVMNLDIDSRAYE